MKRLLHKHYRKYRRVKSVPYKHLKDPEAVEDGTCPICLEGFSDREQVKRIRCGHVFHAGCIDPWLLERSDVCPVCRQNVLDKPNRSYEMELVDEISSIVGMDSQVERQQCVFAFWRDFMCVNIVVVFFFI